MSWHESIGEGLFKQDQADGLRRLLHSSPPAVLAVLPCSSGSSAWLAEQLRARAAAGVRVLALEERLEAGNLADCLGVSMRFDLRQAVEGVMSAQACLSEAMPGLHLVQVAGMVEELGRERIFNQRSISQLRGLRADRDEWVIASQAAQLRGLSQLTLAAPRLLLVLDSQPMTVTTAYASLKRLAAQGGERQVSICFAQTGEARDMQRMDSFCEIALQRLDLPLTRVGSLAEALQPGPCEAGVSVDAFIERLVQTTSGAHPLRGRAAARV